MTIREFNSLEEIQKYYDKGSNTYIFEENEEPIDLIVFNFDLNVEANIKALNISVDNINAIDINACDIEAAVINARDIKAWEIKSWVINARNISYRAVCFAYKNIKCKSIQGRRKNSKHFVLDGTLEVEENVD